MEIPRGMEWELRDQYLNRDVERGQENEGAHQDRELKRAKAECHLCSLTNTHIKEQKNPSKETKKKTIQKGVIKLE